MAKSIFEEIGYDQANKLMANAIAEAARETAALGLPDTVKKNGVWQALFPDGHLAPLQAAVAAPSPAKKAKVHKRFA